MKPKIVIFILFFLFIINVLTAQSKKTKNFLNLLKKYGAYEVIDLETKDNNTPLDILSRASIKIHLNEPDKAIELLTQHREMFIENSLKGKFHLLLARAYRLKGMLFKAICEYELASNYITLKSLLKEPGLKNLFKMVFIKKLYNSIYLGNFLKPDFDSTSLYNLAIKGKSFWPKEEVFSKGLKVLSNIKRKNISLNIPNEHTRDLLIKSLGYISLMDIPRVQIVIKKFQDPVKTIAMYGVLDAVFDTNFLEKQKRNIRKFPKLEGYFNIVLPMIKQYKKIWTIQLPYSPTLLEFKNKLFEMDINSAQRSIDSELKAILVPGNIKEVLLNIKLAYFLINHKYNKLKEIMSHIDFKQLPISLKIGLLLLTDRISSLQDIGLTENHFKQMLFFLMPFNVNPFNINCKFAILTSDIEKSFKNYPIDYLLRYYYLKKIITNSRNINLNVLKQAMFLYPNTILSQSAILKISNKCIDSGAIELFNKYMDMFNINLLNQTLLIKYYKTMAKFYRQTDNIDKAMSYYEKIFNISPTSLDPLTLLKVSLFAQRNNKMELSQNILNFLWKRKDTLDRNIQAEILFWLAEIDQTKGRLNNAIEKYLKVYWFYKDQYIWSITALYRTALIYEQKGKLQVAKRILRDVIKNARRKSQKQAAMARLNSIEQKTKNNHILFLF